MTHPIRYIVFLSLLLPGMTVICGSQSPPAATAKNAKNAEKPAPPENATPNVTVIVKQDQSPSHGYSNDNEDAAKTQVERDTARSTLWLAIGGFLQVLVLLLTLVVIVRQTKILRRHGLELESLAKAAKLNNEANINAARPWLLIPLEKEFSEIQNPILVARLPGEYRRSYCTIRIKNFGGTTAQIVDVKIGMFVGQYDDVPDPRAYEPQDSMGEDYKIPDGASVPVQATFSPDGWITPQDLEAITGKNIKDKRYVWLCGYLKYRDTLDRKDAPIYETRICYRWVNDLNSPAPFWIMAGDRKYSRAT
jgi:hypothetical protein